MTIVDEIYTRNLSKSFVLTALILVVDVWKTLLVKTNGEIISWKRKSMHVAAVMKSF